MSKKLVIKKEWCKGCAICSAFCPKQVLEIKAEKVVIANESACIYCSLCEQRCPDFAIWVEKEAK
ncbi:MAG: 4Fe-4S binding protein [Firmicutes bacterium]|jgi:2-oxoglutarate ferredoxin oxidoreductase subunit delta|nr:4Fe-4S binding protein [Bacillota bacterium]